MTEPAQHPTALPGWLRLWSAVGIAGAIVAVIGMIVLLIPSQQASFGWFAYQPLDEAVFLPSMSVLAPSTIWGFLALTVGLLVVAFSAGFLIGRRTGSTSSD